jgi:hypothetical protein
MVDVKYPGAGWRSTANGTTPALTPEEFRVGFRS